MRVGKKFNMGSDPMASPSMPTTGAQKKKSISFPTFICNLLCVNLQELVLSYPRAASGNCAQVVRLGGMGLHLLLHLVAWSPSLAP